MRHQNREGNKAYDFTLDASQRRPGVSAMMRVKNEAEFIEASVRSVLPYVDEVIVALQPCDDDTPQILTSIKSDKLYLVPYPHEIGKNGPGFRQRNDSASLHSIVYYYNWTLAQTSRRWVLKWDGDMVATPALGAFIAVRREAYLVGREIVKMQDGELWLSLAKPGVNQYPGLFLADDGAHFLEGEACEVFSRSAAMPAEPGVHFLHFKWCKQHFDDVWPSDWQDNPHFRAIYERKRPGKKYIGVVPSQLREKP